LSLQAHYAHAFERDMSCTAAELRAWLPGACGQVALQWQGDDAVVMDAAGGQVRIDWQPLPPRRIALLSLPRMAVRFQATGVNDQAWHAFMRRFDLHTQRGGG
jgi:hypothetical protein